MEGCADGYAYVDGEELQVMSDGLSAAAYMAADKADASCLYAEDDDNDYEVDGKEEGDKETLPDTSAKLFPKEAAGYESCDGKEAHKEGKPSDSVSSGSEGEGEQEEGYCDEKELKKEGGTPLKKEKTGSEDDDPFESLFFDNRGASIQSQWLCMTVTSYLNSCPCPSSSFLASIYADKSETGGVLLTSDWVRNLCPSIKHDMLSNLSCSLILTNYSEWQLPKATANARLIHQVPFVE